MDTISPAFDQAFVAESRSWVPSLSPAVWAGLGLTLLFGAAAAWRLAICFSSVLACTR